MFLLQIILSLVSVVTVHHQAHNIRTQVHSSLPKMLASHEISLNDRYRIASVNEVFKKNILLTIAYMRGLITPRSSINWNQVNKPFHYQFILRPHENFAFHDAVLPQFQGKVTFTTHAHFDAQEGFISDGYLFGDGVCHAASLMAWVARDAGLKVIVPTRHDFAPIPDIPKAEGVAIYDAPGEMHTSALQNLYITNNKDKPVIFAFDYNNSRLTVTAIQDN